MKIESYQTEPEKRKISMKNIAWYWRVPYIFQTPAQINTDKHGCLFMGVPVNSCCRARAVFTRPCMYFSRNVRYSRYQDTDCIGYQFLQKIDWGIRGNDFDQPSETAIVS